RIAGALFLVLTCVWSLAFAQLCESHMNMDLHDDLAQHGCPHCLPPHHDKMDNQGCPDGQCSMERSDDLASVKAESVTSYNQLKLITCLSASAARETAYAVSVGPLARNRHIVEPPPRLKYCTLLI
ncbi:MAG: hypothetical protein V3S33_08255, partial [Gammaproteobacteria bacterium]